MKRAITIAAVLLAGAGLITVVHTDSTTASAEHTLAPAAATQHARQRLRALADSITAAPADTAPAHRYAYLHLRRWILETTGTPVPAGVRPNTPAVTAVDIRQWRAPDGSGRSVDITVGPDYTLAGADPAHTSTQTEFGGGRAVRTTYPAGTPRSITEPLASEPAALARQLAATDPLPDSPAAVLRTTSDLFTIFYVELSIRRTVLRMLADTPGLAVHEPVTDRAGRSGVAVNLTDDGVEHTLIFEPVGGRLLAYQQRSIAAHEYLDVPHGLVRLYTLFLQQSRRPDLN